MASPNIYSGSNGVGSWWSGAGDASSELGQDGDYGWGNTDAGRQAAVQQAIKRYQDESDRQYKLQLQTLKQQAAQIAVTRGTAEANAWYNRQQVKLAKDKMEQDDRHFQATMAENQRQFNTTSSGYLDNGNPTMDREQFQDNSLFNWTGKAIDLASTPKDWVKLARMQSGVKNNLQSIPGLAWTQGGQRGNQAFYGQPESNSLGNVMGGIGVGGTGASTGVNTGGNWASTAAQQIASGSVSGSGVDMTPDQASIYQTAREFGTNPHAAAPGWWEQQDPSTQALIQGAAEAQGLSWADTMSRYNRSRWMGA